MKINLTMSLWKPNQVLFILKTLSINVLIRPQSYKIGLMKYGWGNGAKFRNFIYIRRITDILINIHIHVHENASSVQELRSLSGSIHSTIYVSIHDFIFIQGGRVSFRERMASSLFCATTAAHYVIRRA